MSAQDVSQLFGAGWWQTLREQLVDAGVSQPVIESLAVAFVTATVAHTAPKSDARRVTLDVIGTHFAATSMAVTIGGGDAYIAVTFPAARGTVQ